MAARTLTTSRPSRNVPKADAAANHAKPLYAAEQSLPHLPVPPLTSTFHKYLETLEPILTKEELAHSRSLVARFLDSDQSNTLQARLEARASEKESWLSEWWNEAAYMGYRDRIVPNVNYFYVHSPGIAKGQSQTRRAAELVRAVREFRDLVVTERLEPEKVKGKPLASSSYRQMFGASRVPEKPADVPVTYAPEDAEHVIVMRKNRFFKVDTRGRSASDLEKAFENIVQRVGNEAALPLGALTVENRDVWTDVRRHLLSLSRSNTPAIQALESAIVFVCLDDSAPKSADERSWSIWAGGNTPGAQGKAYNRWFDKHQFIVDTEGNSGFNGEHSMLDGTPTLRMNDFVLTSLDKGKIDLELPAEERNKEPLVPEEIKFVTDAQVESAVKKALNGFAEVMGEHEIRVVHFDRYGKDVIKQFKTSPDAWAQMAKQLAYGKMTGGQPAVTYESAQTRKFKLGRTEVIRSASKESRAFVDAMLGNASDVERAKLFKSAATRHIQYCAWAADGQGVDRHMFGLKKLVREGETMPEVFQDPAFGKSANWMLSTSSLYVPLFNNWGYGEVIPEGFGLSYMVGDKAITWTIATKNGKADELKASLFWAMDELKRMMEDAGKTEAKAKL